MTSLGVKRHDEDVSTSDEDMTPEEFDQRMAQGEPVRIKRGARPVSTVVEVVKTFTSSFGARLASAPATSSATPEGTTVTRGSRDLIIIGSPTA
jgi:hypothetical protein